MAPGKSRAFLLAVGDLGKRLPWDVQVQMFSLGTNNNNKFYSSTDNITEALPAASKAIQRGTMRAKYEIKTKANKGKFTDYK